jgi:hypothetical protein
MHAIRLASIIYSESKQTQPIPVSPLDSFPVPHASEAKEAGSQIPLHGELKQQRLNRAGRRSLAASLARTPAAHNNSRPREPR